LTTSTVGRSALVEGVARNVYVGGAGPAVIVIAEMPGISPDVARFARWVRDAGFSVYLPSLFGRDGAYPDTGEGRQVLERACVSAEFRALGGDVEQATGGIMFATAASPAPAPCPTSELGWSCPLGRTPVATGVDLVTFHAVECGE
jgi:dienelactone hydrolase